MKHVSPGVENVQFVDYLSTSQGLLEIMANNEGLSAVTFVLSPRFPSQENDIVRQAKAQLSQYFERTRTEFSLPIAAQGTPFQKAVWHALLSIKYGETASYADIAKALNNPKAVRAVGMANSKNPIAIIVPCHRVIGSNKTLTGYAGGLDKKQYLLNLEGAQGVLWE
jgi:methylated-DNA-[protein]-cysteine S-methyltransferase